MSREGKMNWEKWVQEYELEEARKASANRREREGKRDTEKERRMRENRKKEWTVFWQGGAPQ